MTKTIDTLFGQFPVIETVFRIFPDARLIGGAVRDFLHDRPIKDFDFLMLREPTQEELDAWFVATGTDLTLMVRSGDYGRILEDRLGAIYTDRSGETKVDIMTTTWSFEDYIADFPDTLSQVSMSSDGRLHMTDNFLYSHMNKIAILEERLRGKKRERRLLEKFGEDYEFIYREKADIYDNTNTTQAVGTGSVQGAQVD